jgi:hypothetical protein
MNDMISAVDAPLVPCIYLWFPVFLRQKIKKEIPSHPFLGLTIEVLHLPENALSLARFQHSIPRFLL